MTHRCFTVFGFPGVRQFIDLILGVVKVQGQLRGRREHMLAYRGEGNRKREELFEYQDVFSLKHVLTRGKIRSQGNSFFSSWAFCRSSTITQITQQYSYLNSLSFTLGSSPTHS